MAVTCRQGAPALSGEWELGFPWRETCGGAGEGRADVEKIWRWGLEGIAYDIYNGPRVVLEKDKRRLGLA
jgi:hypothetical protein